MTYTKLLIWCLLAFLGSSVFIGTSLFFSDFPETVIQMSIWSVLYFTLFCFLALAMGKMMIKSNDLNAMTKLFMVLVFLKLASALALFLIFAAIYQPNDNWYILPFIGSYIAFTIVEIKSLKALSR